MPCIHWILSYAVISLAFELAIWAWRRRGAHARLTRALAQHRDVSFDYDDGEASVRYVVSPRAIITDANGSHLLAYHEAEREYRRFCLCRISGLSVE